MTDGWYFADEHGPVGPMSLTQLQETLATNAGAQHILVWRPGFADWKAVGLVKELQPSDLLGLGIVPRLH
jgi:hypothetical protein